MVNLPDSDLFNRCIEVALKEKWHLLISKREATGTDSLLTHSLNVMSVAETLMKILGDFDEVETFEVLSGCFIHDSGKEDTEVQQILSGENSGSFKHKGDITRKAQLLEAIGVDNSLHETILAIDTIMERPENSSHKIDIACSQVPEEKVWRVVQLADQIVSQKSLDTIELKKGTLFAETLQRLGVNLSYHKVSMIRGITTQLLHNGVMKAYQNHGWTPALYYPDGTVYISRESTTIPERGEILECVKDTVEHYIESIPACELGASAFSGDIRISILNSPEFLFRDDDCVEAFWERIISQKAIRGASFPSEKQKVDDWTKALATKADEEQAVIELRYKKVRAVTRLAIVMKEIASYCEEKRPEAWGFFIKELQERLQVKEGIDKVLRRVANTSPTEQLVEVYNGLTLPTMLCDKDVDFLIRATVIHFKEITKKLREFMNGSIQIDFQKIAEQLLNDLERPLVDDLHMRSLETSRRYQNGKTKGSVSCVLCSSVPTTTATKPMIGEGVESFINLMKGGIRINGDHKAWICPLCEFEAKIRLVFVPDNKETILVLPQLNISESIKKKWSKGLTNLIDGMEDLGLKPLRDRYWIDIIISAKIDADEKQIFTDIIQNNASKEAIIRTVSKWLEETYRSVDDVKTFLANDSTELKDFEDAALHIIEKKLRLPEEVKLDMERYVRKSAGLHCSYVSPNYILITSAFPIAQMDESETSAIIRKVFIGLLLSRLFLASVVYPDIALGMYYHTGPTKGYLRVPKKLGLVNIYKNLGISDWIKVGQIDDMLLKLALYLKVDDLLLATGSSFGKDNLLNLFKKQPGEVLNRHLQVNREINPALYTYLVQANSI